MANRTNRITVPSLITYDTDFQTKYLDVATTNSFTMLSAARRRALNRFLKNLKNVGTYQIAHSINFFSLNDSTIKDCARIDMKRGILYTTAGGIVYNTSGFKTNGIDAYLNTQFSVTNLNFANFGITVGLENDFPASASVLSGLNNTSPTRRIGFFPKTSAANTSVAVYALDLESSQYSNGAPAVRRNVNFGRTGTNDKYVQVNGVRINRTVTPLAAMTGNLCVGAMFSATSTASAFTNGTYAHHFVTEGLTEVMASKTLEIINKCRISLNLPKIV